MTGKDVYYKALSLLNEHEAPGEAQYDTESFERAAPEMINVLTVMLDDLDLHVKHRSFHEATDEPKQIHSLSEPIYLHPAICASVLPLGLAFFLIAEENSARASLFFKLYQSEKEALYRKYRTVRRHKIRSVFQ